MKIINKIEKENNIVKYVLKKSTSKNIDNKFWLRMYYGDIVEILFSDDENMIKEKILNKFYDIYDFSMFKKLIDILDLSNMYAWREKKISIVGLDGSILLKIDESNRNYFSFKEHFKELYIKNNNDYRFITKKLDYFLNNILNINYKEKLIINRNTLAFLKKNKLVVKFTWLNDKYYKIVKNNIYFNSQILFLDIKLAKFLFNKILIDLFPNTKIFIENKTLLEKIYKEFYYLYHEYYKKNVLKFHWNLEINNII